jgi:glycosyltransferase involved in cell wall biosynthesis
VSREKPLVDVIVPVYNGARFLREALESVIAQDYRPLRLIVVDDGSEDESAGIAAALPFVELIRQENRGPGAARNSGLAAARGTFVAFLDADDLLPPTKLTLQVNHLLEHPETACVLGKQAWTDPPPWLSRDVVYGELGGIPLLSAVFRTDVLRAVGGFDHAYRTGEDMDLLFRLRERGLKIAILPDIVLHRRFHGSNLSVVPALPQNRLRSLKAKLDRERAHQQESA